MYDNYNYPPGADTPDAPWNDVDNIIQYECDTCITLRKTIIVDSCDETYNVIENAIREQHTSLTDLLGELAKYIDGELQGDVSPSRKTSSRRCLATARAGLRTTLRLKK
jgi:hypothetical protein